MDPVGDGRAWRPGPGRDVTLGGWVAELCRARHHDGVEPLRLTTSSGRVEVTAEDRADVLVDTGRQHSLAGREEVHGGSQGLRVRVPKGTELIIGSSSGRVTLEGELGSVRVTTRSGRVEIESCAALDARTISGAVDVGRITGDARIKTGNGRVRVGYAGGEVHVATMSGRVELAETGGPTRVNSVSGRVMVALARAEDVRVDSVSGRVVIEVPETVHPEVSLKSISGTCTCEPVQGSDCCVTGRSVSGRIEVVQRP